MNNEAILNILHRVYVRGTQSGNPNYNKKVVEEAAQQLRQYVLWEINETEETRNNLRAGQRQKLNGKEEGK